MKIESTSFQDSPDPSFHTLSRSIQYSSTLPTREGVHTRSPVSPSVSAVNHLGRWGGSLPSSRARRVARWRSSCICFSSFARSYLPISNARWSGRRRQSVGHRNGLSVSSGQSLSVIAYGVRLKGAGGFSEFLHSRIYSAM